VQIAPCLLFDTLTQAAESPAEQTLRHVNIQTHRCGRVIPAYATRYSLSIITYSRAAPEHVAVGGQMRTVDAPAPADGVLQFPVPNTSHVAVIINGYWVAAGTPTLPSVSSVTGTPAETASNVRVEALTARPRTPSTESLHGSSGTAGDIYLDGLGPYPGVDYAHAGVALIGQSATPNIIATLGNDNSQAPTFFGIYNTRRNSSGTAIDSSQLMYVTADAMLRLPGLAIFSGRTSYYETPNIPYDVVHDVSVINPRDHLGGAANRVTFFRSKAEFDGGSPATTKYMAYSRGDSGQSNINFDSQIVLHNGAQYHYRAFSVADPFSIGKDTFWVKAATSGDTVTNTRADMYVSGKVGIGTAAPTRQAEIYGVTVDGNAREVLGLFDTTPMAAGVGGGIAFGGIWNSNGAMAGEFASIQGVKENGTDNNYAGALSFNTRVNNGQPTERLRIDSTGNVGIGITPAAKLDVNGAATVRGALAVTGAINATGSITGATVFATYQDVAEWVPAAESMPAGTVVVVGEDASNTVTPSMHAYDTSVAGVVSATPGLLLGVASESKAKIATTGRVRVRVDATKSPIHKGDLLVTSDRPGMAMKSEPLDINGRKFHQPGTLIGKALEPLASGTGEILVLLSLQ